MASPGVSFALIQATLVCSKGLNRMEEPYACFNAGVWHNNNFLRDSKFLVPDESKVVKHGR
jgi:hypothetical protein